MIADLAGDSRRFLRSRRPRRSRGWSRPVVRRAPVANVEYMGVIPAIVTAIVSGAIAIGTTVAGAVAKKKQQKREKAMLEKQQAHELAMQQAAAAPAGGGLLPSGSAGMLLPVAALGLGALLLKKIL